MPTTAFRSPAAARPRHLPLFLHTVSAAGFADVGHAWTGAFNARDVKSAIGGELSFDVVAGYPFA